VERLRAAVESTGAEGFGGFAGLHPLDEHRLLAASTDSVGSKLMLSRRAGRLRWAGMDLAAHCINDVLCSGADPLFLLDYVAANRIDTEQVAELVEGAAEVCRAAEEDGFFFSGLGPAFAADGDALLMQFLAEDLDLSLIQIENPFAKELLTYVGRERERVQKARQRKLA